MITAQTTLQELLDAAVQNAATLVNVGEKFIVRDLFTPIEWRRLPVSLRIQLGSLFLHYVNTNPGLYEAVSKTAQKQQIYIKH